MFRAAAVAIASAALLVLAPTSSSAQTPAAAPPLTVATPADAAPFLGAWTVKGESPVGPFTNVVTVKVEGEKIVGTVSSDLQPTAQFSDVQKTGVVLVVRYQFQYQGMDVPAVLTLTPKAAAKDQLDAYFSFAGGSFEMTGIGTKTP